MNSIRHDRMHYPLGIGLIAGAALYRPLVFWARNAWDLHSPAPVFATSAIVFGVGVSMYLGARRLPVRELPAAFFIAAGMFIAYHYHEISLLPGWIWFTLVAVTSALMHRVLSDEMLSRVAIVLLAVTLGAPALQVGVEHLSRRTPYPLAELGPRPVSAEPTGQLEDILVLVVDSYPMVAVATDWFDHDTGPLEKGLKRAGFTVPRVSWSHNTFTSLAVPSLVQLDQVIDDTPKYDWGNRTSTYEIVGGDNLVAETLKKAGFGYHHIESGWNGAKCRQVDTCHRSTWLDEAAWALLAPSLVSSWFEERYGSMAALNTTRAVKHLRGLDVFGDGHNDYVFGHLMLPHAPYVLDDECNVVASADRSERNDDHEAIRQQLGCVDSLLMDIVEDLPDSTAVLIAADHGTGVGGQVGAAARTWSEGDVAERLGALLAYKLPERCAEPDRQSNVYAMRAILDCAVDATLPSDPVPFVVGDHEPLEIEWDRLAAIGNLIEGQQLESPGP